MISGYRQTSTNVAASKNTIQTYLCPSDPWAAVKEPMGYGKIDYFATVYTDIDPTAASGMPSRFSVKTVRCRCPRPHGRHRRRHVEYDPEHRGRRPELLRRTAPALIPTTTALAAPPDLLEVRRQHRRSSESLKG